MSSQPTNMPSHHARSHKISTPRLVIRSAKVSEAKAVCELLSNPANSPHEPVNQDFTPEIMEQRIAKWSVASSEGRSGFMVIALRSNRSNRRISGAIASEATTSLVDHGLSSADMDDENENRAETIIGFGGFNSFFYKSSSTPEASGDETLVGDVGIMLDHKYWRQRYGLEALTAIVDYGFDQLNCGRIFMGTEVRNVAWRTMMNKTLCLEAYESREKAESGPSKGADGYAWKFGKKEWESARRRRDR